MVDDTTNDTIHYKSVVVNKSVGVGQRRQSWSLLNKVYRQGVAAKTVARGVYQQQLNTSIGSPLLPRSDD